MSVMVFMTDDDVDKQTKDKGSQKRLITVLLSLWLYYFLIQFRSSITYFEGT